MSLYPSAVLSEPDSDVGLNSHIIVSGVQMLHTAPSK